MNEFLYTVNSFWKQQSECKNDHVIQVYNYNDLTSGQFIVSSPIFQANWRQKETNFDT